MHLLRVNLQLFWQGAVLSYRALFQWLTPALYLASKIVSPFSQMIFFTLLGTLATGAQTASFYVVGNAMQIAAMSGIYGATMSIGGDRGNGTLPYLFGAPANRLLIFAGRVSFHILDGMLNVVIGFVWGILILGLDLSRTDLPALALTILITTFSTSGLGLLMGCLSLITVNVIGFNVFVKVQTTGPCSFALTITDENKRAIYYNEEFRDVIIKALAMKCRSTVE